MEPNNEVIQLSILPEVKDAIASFNPVTAGLAAMREKYANLKVIDISDKEGYETLKLAKADCVKTRTAIDPVRKKLTEDARMFTAAVNEEAKRIIAEIEQIEAPLTAEKARIDALIAAEKQRKIDEGLNEYNRRINLCIATGMVFETALINNTPTQVYSLGKFQVKPHQIQVASEENFNKFIASVEKEAESLRFTKEEAERLRLEEEQRAKDELKAEQERLKREREELEAKQKELETAQVEVQKNEESLIERAKEIESQGKAIEQAKTEITRIWNAPEPIRSAEEATEENAYRHGVTDRARLANFAQYLSFNMPQMVPVVTEEWAIPIAAKMVEQFDKMAKYILNNLPNGN